MAQARLKTWVAAEVLYAADLNNEFGNILNNALAVISPLTGSLDAGGFDITALDELAFSDAAAGASVAGRLRRNGTNLEYHDGTASRVIYKASGTDVAIADGGTNSSTALNNNRIMVSSGGAIVEAGVMTNGQLLIGSTGAAPVVAALTQGSNITITNAAGSITIAAAASAESGTWSDVSGSRAFDTIYQNTGGKKRRVALTVQVNAGAQDRVTVQVGSASPPATAIMQNVGTAAALAGWAGNFAISFEVPNNWYYRLVIVNGTPGFQGWGELDE